MQRIGFLSFSNNKLKVLDPLFFDELKVKQIDLRGNLSLDLELFNVKEKDVKEQLIERLFLFAFNEGIKKKKKEY